MSRSRSGSPSPVRAVGVAVLLTVLAVIVANVVGVAFLVPVLLAGVALDEVELLLYLTAAGQFGLLTFGLLYVWSRDFVVPFEVPSGSDLRYIVGGTVAALVLATGISYGLQVFDLLPGAVIEDAAAVDRRVLLALGALSVLIVAPAEELLFRGIVQGRLRETFGPAGAILGASLLFGSLHLPNYLGPATQMVAGALLITVTGAVLGYLYERTGNLTVPVVAHAAYNVVLSAVGYLSA